MTDTDTTVESAADKRLRLMRGSSRYLLKAAREVGGVNQQTRDIPSARQVEHAEHAWAALRYIVETWAACSSPVPQPLGLAVIEGKKAINAALAKE